MDDAELLRRAVIGVVARQIDEVDRSAGAGVDLIDDATEIAVVLQAGIGDVEIADLKKTLPKVQIRR